MPTASDAIAYAEKGWRVFPVPPGTKKPNLPDWPSIATIEHDRINEWWKISPKANIAVVTGKTSGIVVLDIDGDKGKASLDELTAEYGGLPPTYTEKSPNGLHYFFNYPDSDIATGSGIVPSIDVQSDKRCIVVAPSIVNGKSYQLINDAPVIDLPDWLVARLLKGPTNLKDPDGPGPNQLPGFVKGERNQNIFLYACGLRAKGNSIEEAQKLVLAQAEACKPPFSPTEALCCLQSAWKYNTRFDLNDVGNAKRLIALFGDSLLKPTFQKQWLVLDGDIWRSDVDGQITRFAKQAVQTIATEARNQKDPDYQKAMRRHAKGSGNLRGIESMIKLAESEKGTPVAADQVDADPFLLGTLSGILDLRVQALIDTEQVVTKRIPLNFNTEATCSRWIQFLEEIFAGDEELIRYIQQAIGYSLTGRTDEQCLFFLYGSGANGKSTFLNVVRHLLGEYAVTAPPTVLMCKGGQDNAAIASMHGARLSVASEVGEDSRFDEVMVKQITGGDPVTCRHLYAEYFTYTPQFKMWIGGNHKPQIRGTDYAIWRRIKLIPFTVTFAEEKRDPKLEQKLKFESEGILNWAIEGCREWMNHGLVEPKVVTEATSEYRSEFDIVGQFLDDRCLLGSSTDIIAASVLYEEYRDWCGVTGNNTMSMTMFGRKLVERGLGKKKKKKGTVYLGIRLRPDEQLTKFGKAS